MGGDSESLSTMTTSSSSLGVLLCSGSIEREEWQESNINNYHLKINEVALSWVLFQIGKSEN